MHVSVFWEVVAKGRILPGGREDLCDAKCLVLRNEEILDIFTLDTTLMLDEKMSTYNLRLPMMRSFSK